MTRKDPLSNVKAEKNLNIAEVEHCFNELIKLKILRKLAGNGESLRRVLNMITELVSYHPLLQLIKKLGLKPLEIFDGIKILDLLVMNGFLECEDIKSDVGEYEQTRAYQKMCSELLSLLNDVKVGTCPDILSSKGITHIENGKVVEIKLSRETWSSRVYLF